MTRGMCGLCAGAMVLGILALAGTSQAITFNANWVGSAGGGDGVHWSDPKNWDLNSVPINTGPVQFNVTIPSTFTLPQLDTGTPLPTDAYTHITSFTLGDNSELTVVAHTGLVVTTNSTINGVLNGTGGNFVSTYTDATWPSVDPTTPLDLGTTTTTLGNRSRFYVSNGSHFKIDATGTYSSTGLSDATLMSASGSGSVLDLSALTSINAGFNDSYGGYSNVQTISATSSGQIKLGNVTQITAPVQGNDYLNITADTGGSIDLSKLATTSSASGGYVSFNVNGAATSLNLPALTSVATTQFLVTGGATLNANNGSATYSSATGGLEDRTLMSASGTGSVLDLSALTSINAGFNDSYGGYSDLQTISATSSGQIKLGNVTQITAPVQGNDYLNITASGGGKINLSKLQSVAPAAGGGGWVYFTLTSPYTLIDGNGANVGLPALTQTQRAYFNVSGGTVNLPALVALQDTSFNVTGGAQVVANHAPANGTYSSTGLSDATLMSASGSGSVLDLSALTSINAGFNDSYGGYSNVQTISATSSGQIKLGNVTQITAPVQGNDYLNITADTGGSIDLSKLATTSSASGGYVSFNVNGAATSLNLPALTSVATTQFLVTGGATLNANNGSATYSSATGGLEDRTLMSASGTGSVLDLSALTSINAGFNDSYGGYSDLQTISATSSGQIKLGNVTQITAPVQGNDYLNITASGGGSFSAPKLYRLLSASSGYFSMTGTGAGSLIDMSGLRGGIANTTTSLSSGAELRTGELELTGITTLNLNNATAKLRGLHANGTGSGGIVATISLQNAADQLQISRTLDLGTNIKIAPVASGATVTIGNDFINSHTNEANVNLNPAFVQFNGGGVQQLEVGGLDFGGIDPGNNGNFGFGQMVIGQPSQPTIVNLTDLINNGNRGSQGEPEALYLFGIGGQGGLKINSGSILVLNGLDVYAGPGSPLSQVNPVFPVGQPWVTYDQGRIYRSFLDLPTVWTGAISSNWRVMGNWNEHYPDGIGQAAIFDSNSTTPWNISVDGPVTVGSILIDRAATTTISGPGSVTMAMPGDALATIGIDTTNGKLAHQIAANLILDSDTEVINNTNQIFTLSGQIDNSLGHELRKSGPGEMDITGVQVHGAGALLEVKEGTVKFNLASDGNQPNLLVRTDGGASLNIPAGNWALKAIDTGPLSGGNSVLGAGVNLTADSVRQNSLTLGAGGSVTLRASGADVNVSRLSQLVIPGANNAWTAKVDVNDNKMIIDNANSTVAGTTYTTVNNQLKQGFDGGAWDGQGIVSTKAQTNVNNGVPVTIGVINNDAGSGNPAFYGDGTPATGGLPQFGGQNVNGTAVLTKYTYFGDANLSGTVDAVDYTFFVAGVQSGGTLTGWEWGDFDYSGTIDAVDYTFFVFGVQGQGAALAGGGSGPTSVPEPASLALLGLGGMLMLKRRNRKV